MLQVTLTEKRLRCSASLREECAVGPCDWRLPHEKEEQD